MGKKGVVVRRGSINVHLTRKGRGVPAHKPPTTVRVRLEDGRVVTSIENPDNEWLIEYLKRLGGLG